MIRIIDWNNKKDRELYYNFPTEKELGREYTEEENDFFRTMYHLEERACGLD